MSNFGFLAGEWPELFAEAEMAEKAVKADPRTSCFYARRTLEAAVNWLYRADESLRLPYQSNLDAMISEPTMVNLVGPAIRTKMHVIRRQGNAAVHHVAAVPEQAARQTLAELFHVTYWIARHYTRDPANRPPSPLRFDPALIPESTTGTRLRLAELQAMAAELERKQHDLVEARRRNEMLDEQVTRLRAEVAAAKAANLAAPDTHDYDEATTRAVIIDLLLREAGWALDGDRDREFPVDGLPTKTGRGRVDYVLWDDDGAPLGLVEAKRTSTDAITGKQQARAYADALEQRFGQRPVIFYTNGYQTYIWDDAAPYPPREIQGFYTKSELRTLIARRAGRQSLAALAVNEDIAGRNYQARAIHNVTETFERKRQRQALLVMATGAGKTRTTIALVELLQRAGWVKRVLFLADRQALVTQAVNAFKQHLPGTPVVNLLAERGAEGRVYVSTYPTMMGLINDTADGVRRFGPGHFDLVVIDEAHRSVFQKYGTLLEYFDALLVGLTATPKDEIDRNTYRLFHLEDGVPTDVYTLDEAVDEGWLVAPHTINVPLKFPQRGIRYDELSEQEKLDWEMIDWDDDAGMPTEVAAPDINRFLFNADTIDKMLETLMAYGYTVDGGDRLGKTIIFARNTNHAKFIVERFDAMYPNLGGVFAEMITHDTNGAQARIEAFARRASAPHIAVSVDMLDTGIDIPEVLNLVFAKLVGSKTKFWQMMGRGTRLCPDLFGPNRDKDGFLVFDMGRNVEFFKAGIATAEGHLQPSLRERLFRRRVELLYTLDHVTQGAGEPGDEPGDGTESEGGLRRDVADRLRSEVAAMDDRNVEVRRHLREVETYREPENWRQVTAEVRDEVSEHLAGLPTAYTDDENGEEAKRFDLLALRLQLGVLGAESSFDTLRAQVQDIAEALLDPTTLANPVVAPHRELLAGLVGDDWWTGVTLPMLEAMRRRVRGLVRLIPKARRGVVYTDFTDELGELTEEELSGVQLGVNLTRFEAKVRTYLRSHTDQLAVQKLLRNRQITGVDMQTLQRIFVESGIGSEHDIARAADEHGGLGLFLRSISGLDYEAATAAFDAFQAGKTFSADQLHFLRLLIGYLAKNGTVAAKELFRPPFTGLAPSGPTALFPEGDVRAIADILDAVRRTAIPPDAATA